MLGAVADAVVEGPAGPTAPNRLTVSLSGEPAEAHVVDAAAADLAGLVDAAADEHGWRFEGPVQVGFAFLDAADGPARAEAVVAPGDLPAWAELSQVAGSDTVTVHHRRAVVGRSSNADVSLDANTVSRRHALVIRQAGTHWLADLGSANGTYLNGAPVGSPVEIVAGDVLGFADVAYSFRLLEAP